MIKLRVICEPRRDFEEKIDCVVDDPDGFLEATDIRRSPVVYSCRGVACGSCFVEVDHPEFFEPADQNELAVLHNMGADSPRQRMACALRVKEGIEGTVKVKMAY